MEKIILDFGKDKVVIPNCLSYSMLFLTNGMKVMHNGEHYLTGEKTVLGLDEYAKEYASWDNNSEIKNNISLHIKMIKCNE